MIFSSKGLKAEKTTALWSTPQSSNPADDSSPDNIFVLKYILNTFREKEALKAKEFRILVKYSFYLFLLILNLAIKKTVAYIKTILWF